MATRTRTAVFLQHRNQYHSAPKPLSSHRSRENDGLIDNVVEMDSYGETPVWVHLRNKYFEKSQLIEAHAVELTSLNKSSLKTNFNDDDDLEIKKKHLNNLILAEITEAKQLIQRIAQTPKNEHPDEAKTRLNVQQNLAMHCQTLSQRFGSDQRKTYQVLQERERKAKQMTQSLDAFNVPDPGFTQAQMTQLVNHETFVESRVQAINDLAASINSLQQMFIDLQTLVIDQGTILDRIDYNIELVVQNTAAAHSELVDANQSQKKARSKMCIILLVVIVVFLILLVSLKPRGLLGGGGTSAAGHVTPSFAVTMLVGSVGYVLLY